MNLHLSNDGLNLLTHLPQQLPILGFGLINRCPPLQTGFAHFTEAQAIVGGFFIGTQM